MAAKLKTAPAKRAGPSADAEIDTKDLGDEETYLRPLQHLNRLRLALAVMGGLLLGGVVCGGFAYAYALTQPTDPAFTADDRDLLLSLHNRPPSEKRDDLTPHLAQLNAQRTTIETLDRLAKEAKKAAAAAEDTAKTLAVSHGKQVTELNATIDKLKVEIKGLQGKTTTAPESVPQDILICVLHSSKLPYSTDVRPALARLFRQQRQPPGHRLGLAIGITDKLGPPVVKLGEDGRAKPEAAFDQALTTSVNLTENPDDPIAGQLYELLKGSKGSKSRPRVVFVASTECHAPRIKPDHNGWKDLDSLTNLRVDVVLVPPALEKPAERPAPAPDAAPDWFAFCGQRNGGCYTMKRPAMAEKLTEELLARLRELTAPQEKALEGERK